MPPWVVALVVVGVVGSIVTLKVLDYRFTIVQDAGACGLVGSGLMVGRLSCALPCLLLPPATLPRAVQSGL